MIKYAAKKGEQMAYRYGNRGQFGLFPQSIEDYVSKEDPVRVYDAFVEGIDFGELGIDLDEHQVGNSEYDPKAMLKLLVYGYSYGLKGARKLERACHHNVSFMWLMGGLKPDHKTIAEFRRGHKKALKQVLKQCVRLCIKLDLIMRRGERPMIEPTMRRCWVSWTVGSRSCWRNVSGSIDRKRGWGQVWQ